MELIDRVEMLCGQHLADADEADVAVEHVGLDLELRVLRHDAHDLLPARHHLTDIGDDGRLHPSGDRRPQGQVLDSRLRHLIPSLNTIEPLNGP